MLSGARRATLTMLATFLIAMTAQTAWAQDPATIGSISYNSTLGAYEINSVDNLKDLAVYVNGSGNYSTGGSETTCHNCYGLTFIVTDDITYPHDSDWNDDTSREDKYTAIGHNSSYFRGHFNGNGKTISGIRIYKNGYSDRGIFGCIAYPAVVENITLADTRITAVNTVGGIVGENAGGTIDNCHVTNTVKLRALDSSSSKYGGIVGHNYIYSVGEGEKGVVCNCISEAVLTSCLSEIGGIAGKNDGGKLENNFVIGATIPAATGAYKSYGAIAGQNNNNGTFSNNYYSRCTVGGVKNATNVGVGADNSDNPGDITENNGAVVDEWGLRDGNVGSETKPYIITTTAGLDLLAQKVNAGTSYEGKYFKLGDNIAYDKNTENNFTPIGYVLEKDNGEAVYFPFKGHFDGNGKTISGINIKNSSARYQCIFGYLYGTVKNLVVSNCSIVADHNIGAIVGVLYGTIENCHVGSDVTLSGHLHVGGIAGWCADATIKGCTSAATITGTNSSDDNANRLGGIVGATNGPSSLTDNLFTGAINGKLEEYIGAIFGWGNEYATLTNNVHTSTVLGGIGAASSTTGADGAGARKAVEIGAAEGVTITPTGKATTYNVSGITTYADNNVLGCDSKLYAGATDAVKLSIVNTGTPETGYEFSGFTAGEGVTITSSENVYTLTVPASDVTVDVVYQAIIYNITYKGVEDEGVTFTEDNPEAYTVANENFTLSNPSREGYLFMGWTYEGQTEPTKTVTIAKGSTGDKTFTANWKKLLTNEDITVGTIADQTYTGSEIKPAITVKDGTTDITDQCDFTYNSNKVVGTAEVVISAKESSATYAGEKTVTFKIAPKTVSTPTITLSGTSFEYTGEAIKPTVTVKDGETTIPAEEYTVGYSNNIEAGTATVTITDNEGGNYTVSGTATFTITPKPNTAVVNVEETPVAIGGETYYGLTKEAQEIFKGDNASYVPSIGLSSEAINRVELTEEGDLKFSQGPNVHLAVRDLNSGDNVKLSFDGTFYAESDGIYANIHGLARSRGDSSSDGMIELVSGAEYKVLKDGDLILTIVLENEEAVLKGITVTKAGTSTDEPTSIVVTAKNKYWTFSCDQDVKVPEGVKVYTCQLNSKGTKAIITELSATELGGVIKANNGVLLSSDPGDYTFVFSPETTSQAKTYENNALVAVVKPTHFSPNDYYVLKDNEFHVILDDETEVPANKAVLKKPTGASGSRTIGIDEGDDATRIWGVSVADEDAVWYTVSGQRIDKPTKKGLYIKNGVKVVVK